MSFTRYQFRRGKLAEWVAAQTASPNNPILAEGEMGYITDTGRAKIGDGIKKWNELPYIDSSGNTGVLDLSSSDSGSILVKNAAGLVKYSDILKIRDSKEPDLSGSVVIKGAVLPAAANTFSLGATGARWSNIFMGASGDIHLGFTTMSDRSGNLQISGSLYSSTNTASLGTVANPWKSLQLGSSALTASGDNVYISTADSSLYNDANIQGQEKLQDTPGDLYQVCISADGSLISYTDGSNIILLFGNNRTHILRASTYSGSESIGYIVLVYSVNITKNKKYIYGVILTADASNTNYTKRILSYNIEQNIYQYLDYISATMLDHLSIITSADGNILVFYNTSATDNFITIFERVGSTLTKIEIDPIPSISGLKRYTTVNISDDGTKVVVSFHITENASANFGNTYNYLLVRGSTGFTVYNTGTTYRALNITPDGSMLVAGCLNGTNGIYITTSATDIYVGNTTNPSNITWSPIPNTSRSWFTLTLTNDNIIFGVDIDQKLIQYNRNTNGPIKEIRGTVNREWYTIGISSTSISYTIISTYLKTLYVDTNNKVQQITKVGIGTGAPSARLEIANPSPAAESNALLLRNTGLETGQSISMSFATDAGSSTNAKILVDGSNNSAMRFFTLTNGSLTEKMRLESSGTVLVPGSLQVSGSMIAPNQNLISNYLGHPTVLSLQSNVNTYDGMQTNGPSIDFNTRWLGGSNSPYLQAAIQGIDTAINDRTTGGLRFIVNKGGVPTEIMRLQPMETVLYGQTSLADILFPGNILKSGLTIRTTTGSQVLKMGAYYMNTTSTGSAIQAADQYVVDGVLKDNPNTLTLNPLGGTVSVGGSLNIQRNMGADSDGLVVQHTNGTQGIGMGYNTIYASGSNANQDLNLRAKGTGIVKIDGIANITNRLSIESTYGSTYTSYSGAIGNTSAPSFAGINSARLVVDSHSSVADLKYGRYFEYPKSIYLVAGGALNATSDGTGDSSTTGMLPFGIDTINIGGQANSLLQRKISIFGDSYIVSSRGFAAFSDERIKTNIKPIDDNDSLGKIRNIEPVEYTYIDKIENPHSRPIYGFIAQQVQKHFPDAVNTTDRYIPNIYNFKEYSVDISANTLTIYDISESIVESTNVGNFVKLYDASDQQFLLRITEIQKPTTFVCDISGIKKLPVVHDKLQNKIFCYGTHVSDFLVLEKDYLFTLNFAATQELDRVVQAQAAEIADLKSKNAELERKLAAVIAHLGINLN